MASAMPSSAAAVEGLEEGDAIDVSSLSLSLAFLREDMFKMSSSGFVLQKVWGLCRKLEPSRICVTQNKKCLSDQSHSRFPEESTKEEGEEEKDKDAMPLHVRKKKDDDKEEE